MQEKRSDTDTRSGCGRDAACWVGEGRTRCGATRRRRWRSGVILHLWERRRGAAGVQVGGRSFGSGSIGSTRCVKKFKGRMREVRWRKAKRMGHKVAALAHRGGQTRRKTTMASRSSGAQIGRTAHDLERAVWGNRWRRSRAFRRNKRCFNCSSKSLGIKEERELVIEL